MTVYTGPVIANGAAFASATLRTGFSDLAATLRAIDGTNITTNGILEARKLARDALTITPHSANLGSEHAFPLVFNAAADNPMGNRRNLWTPVSLRFYVPVTRNTFYSVAYQFTRLKFDWLVAAETLTLDLLFNLRLNGATIRQGRWTETFPAYGAALGGQQIGAGFAVQGFSSLAAGFHDIALQVNATGSTTTNATADQVAQLSGLGSGTMVLGVQA